MEHVICEYKISKLLGRTQTEIIYKLKKQISKHKFCEEDTQIAVKIVSSTSKLNDALPMISLDAMKKYIQGNESGSIIDGDFKTFPLRVQLFICLIPIQGASHAKDRPWIGYKHMRSAIQMKSKAAVYKKGFYCMHRNDEWNCNVYECDHLTGEKDTQQIAESHNENVQMWETDIDEVTAIVLNRWRPLIQHLDAISKEHDPMRCFQHTDPVLSFYFFLNVECVNKYIHNIIFSIAYNNSHLLHVIDHRFQCYQQIHALHEDQKKCDAPDAIENQYIPSLSPLFVGFIDSYCLCMKDSFGQLLYQAFFPFGIALFAVEMSSAEEQNMRAIIEAFIDKEITFVVCMLYYLLKHHKGSKDSLLHNLYILNISNKKNWSFSYMLESFVCDFIRWTWKCVQKTFTEQNTSLKSFIHTEMGQIEELLRRNDNLFRIKSK